MRLHTRTKKKAIQPTDLAEKQISCDCPQTDGPAACLGSCSMRCVCVCLLYMLVAGRRERERDGGEGCEEGERRRGTEKKNLCGWIFRLVGGGKALRGIYRRSAACWQISAHRLESKPACGWISPAQAFSNRIGKKNRDPFGCIGLVAGGWVRCCWVGKKTE